MNRGTAPRASHARHCRCFQTLRRYICKSHHATSRCILPQSLRVRRHLRAFFSPVLLSTVSESAAIALFHSAISSGVRLSAKSISGMSNVLPSRLEADITQHHRYVQRSVKLSGSISVISRPVSCLKRSIAPIVGLQGYAVPFTLISMRLIMLLLQGFREFR